jgi:hypothetical protein
VAPDPDAFAVLMDKTGELQRLPHDWSEEIRRLTTGVLLVFADADSIPPATLLSSMPYWAEVNATQAGTGLAAPSHNWPSSPVSATTTSSGQCCSSK